MTTARISLTLFLLFLNWYLPASENPYFTQLLARISENIEEGAYEQNVEEVSVLERQEAFQALSCYQKGQIFHKIGVSYYLLNREQEAIRIYRDSVLAIWQNCPEVPATERANTIYNIGICYQYLGDARQAKRQLDKALIIFESDADYPPFDLAKKYQGIANFYRDSYDPFRAELYYENALNIYRLIKGTEVRQFDILNSFLIMSLDFRKYEKAGIYFEQAMALYRKHPEAIDDYDLSILYQNAGIAYFEQGELQRALETTQSGAALIDPVDAPALYSNASEKIAMINGKKGQFAQAIEGLNEVVLIRSGHLSNPESYQHLAYAYENLHEIYQRQGDLIHADEFLQKAFDALMIKGVYDADGLPVVSRSVAINDLDLARLLSLKIKLFHNEFAKSRDPVVLKKSLDLHARIDTVISRQLLSMQFQKSKLNFLALIQGYYGQAIEDAGQLYQLTGERRYLEQAYFFSAKTKAIILRNELSEADAFKSIASPAMIDQEKALVRQMFGIQEQLATNGTDKDSLLRKYVETQRELDGFLQNIAQEAPEYYQNKYAFITPPGVGAIQSGLPRNLAVVEFFYRADTIYSFWITQDRFFQITIDNDEKLEQTLRSFVDQCHDPKLAISIDLGHQLYQDLLSKGLDQLPASITRLCIIPDGILHTLPFETLPITVGERGKLLLENYSVTYSYSSGLLFRGKARSFDLPYLGFGAGYSSGLSQKLKSRRLLFGEENLAQLVLNREEIIRAAGIFSGKSFLGQDANLDNFYRYSANARIIHLSLHGLVDFDDPLRSSILFDDHRDAFILSASDLYSYKINADLVILSACHSADGKIYLGEGVQGMSKAFMLSGVRSVLSSLWNASEAGSLELMTVFLGNVRQGMPHDVALQRAKLDYLASARPSQQHPFYWANFIIIGEVNAPERPFSPALKILLAILSLAGLFLFFKRYLFSIRLFSKRS